MRSEMIGSTLCFHVRLALRERWSMVSGCLFEGGEVFVAAGGHGESTGTVPESECRIDPSVVASSTAAILIQSDAKWTTSRKGWNGTSLALNFSRVGTAATCYSSRKKDEGNCVPRSVMAVAKFSDDEVDR